MFDFNNSKPTVFCVHCNKMVGYDTDVAKVNLLFAELILVTMKKLHSVRNVAMKFILLPTMTLT